MIMLRAQPDRTSSDRNQRWHKYDLVAPTPDVLALLDELDRDPACIFWG